MDYIGTRGVCRALDENAKTIKTLFRNAEDMRNSLNDIQNKTDRDLVIQKYNAIAESINNLLSSSTVLYNTLNRYMEE